MIDISILSRRALLIEDDNDVFLSRKAMLESLSFTVTSATTFEQSMKYLEQANEPFHLAIIDVFLRREGESIAEHPLGLDIVRFIKNTSPSTAVVISTAYPQYVQEVLQMISQGVTGIAFVVKGTIGPILYEAITHTLEGAVYLRYSKTSTMSYQADALFLAALPGGLIEIIKRIADAFDELSPREQDVSRLLSYQESAIADKLGVRIAAVHQHKTNIRNKLAIHLDSKLMPRIEVDTLIVLAVLLRRLRGKER